MNNKITIKKIAITFISLAGISYAQRTPTPLTGEAWESLVITGSESAEVVFPLDNQSSQSYTAYFADSADAPGTIREEWTGTVTTEVTAVSSGTGVDSASVLNTSTDLRLGSVGFIADIKPIYFPHTEELTSAGLTNVYNLEYDFTGLKNGYLPSGTLIYVRDIDGVGANTELLSIAATPLVNTRAAAFEIYYNGSVTGETHYDVTSNVLSVNNLGSADQPSQTVAWLTTKDITSFSVDASALRNNGSFQFGFAAPVPEPSSTALLGLGALGLLARRKR